MFFPGRLSVVASLVSPSLRKLFLVTDHQVIEVLCRTRHFAQHRKLRFITLTAKIACFSHRQSFEFGFMHTSAHCTVPGLHGCTHLTALVIFALHSVFDFVFCCCVFYYFFVFDFMGIQSPLRFSRDRNLHKVLELTICLPCYATFT